MTDAIKLYWQQRAVTNKGNLTTTTDDIYFRSLEINTLSNFINKNSLANQKLSILDLGCGDGYMAVCLAEKHSNIHIHGTDFSANMIDLAQEKLMQDSTLQERVSFSVADVLELDNLKFSQNSYDLIITSRMLINLTSSSAQYATINKISSLLTNGGYYLGLENFIETHENLNSARNAVGLPKLDMRWHNLYFAEEEFVSKVDKIFTNLDIFDFASSYFFATRVVYAFMCQLENKTPDYLHPIHQSSINLPVMGQFSPVRFIVARK